MDKFINATHLIQTLEDTKPLIDNSPVSAFQKTVCKMTLNGAIQYMQEEMAAGGEFRRVVHAHWIEHFEDFGESFFVDGLDEHREIAGHSLCQTLCHGEDLLGAQ